MENNVVKFDFAQENIRLLLNGRVTFPSCFRLALVDFIYCKYFTL